MISNLKRQGCFPEPFKTQIQNEMFDMRPQGIISEKEILRHFRQRAIATLNEYSECRRDIVYPVTHGVERWEKKLSSKWFDVSRMFHLYIEVRNQIGKPKK